MPGVEIRQRAASEGQRGGRRGQEGGPWVLVPCDKKSDLKIYVGQCDLYFMDQ